VGVIWGSLEGALGGGVNEFPGYMQKLVVNSAIKPLEKGITNEFIEALLNLEVLGKVLKEIKLQNNCPPFLIPKGGQPGQFYCIPNMRCGKQSEVCGADPVQMIQPQWYLTSSLPWQVQFMYRWIQILSHVSNSGRRETVYGPYSPGHRGVLLVPMPPNGIMQFPGHFRLFWS